ncbi:hypothetical protein HYV79_03410 [Candidatus Woesearchaeota archaeon]|nr:hypothetical protein [Candidatus Woesearchaeota archaeon]
MAEQLETVDYFINLKYDPKRLSKEYAAALFFGANQLLKQYPEISIVNEFAHAVSLMARSKKQDFEKLYDVKLNYETFTILLNKEFKQVSELRSNGTPQIPQGLESIVHSISLVSAVFSMK